MRIALESENNRANSALPSSDCCGQVSISPKPKIFSELQPGRSAQAHWQPSIASLHCR